MCLLEEIEFGSKLLEDRVVSRLLKGRESSKLDKLEA